MRLSRLEAYWNLLNQNLSLLVRSGLGHSKIMLSCRFQQNIPLNCHHREECSTGISCSYFGVLPFSLLYFLLALEGPLPFVFFTLRFLCFLSLSQVLIYLFFPCHLLWNKGRILHNCYSEIFIGKMWSLSFLRANLLRLYLITWLS